MQQGFNCVPSCDYVRICMYSQWSIPGIQAMPKLDNVCYISTDMGAGVILLRVLNGEHMARDGVNSTP